MDYVKPHAVVENMLAGVAVKLNVPARHLVIRGMLAGAYLGVATSMAVSVAVETGFWIAGALLFPFGLALAILLGMEIITGSFALIPCAVVSGKAHNERVGIPRVLANWGWVFLGNLLGSTLYAAVARHRAHYWWGRSSLRSRDQADCHCGSEDDVLCPSWRCGVTDGVYESHPVQLDGWISRGVCLFHHVLHWENGCDLGTDGSVLFSGV